ncbi:hypothetical protein, conserved [Leishmania donovani]|uniref:Paraquat-inducible protein A, putative n=2 Tax=Leishmania donovani TaxID=5661 RepID=E9BIS3_LEIDO|nr:hypothetical protein, conserved [Leishmania donovani]AYU79865.1 Paraquat-inducible protein A, putative [Leishmania donovani]CBZ35149.1 hypothetical protein, conserved [Leishmania donovani]
MMPYSQCLSTVLFLSTLNFTNVSIPSFNESLLGVNAFNLTCFDVYMRGFGTSWMPTRSYAAITDGGNIRCRTNLTAFAYSGVVWADVVVNPGEVRLARTIEKPDSPDMCITNASSITDCHVNVSVVDLHADPPSSLIDLILAQAKTYVNNHASDYVCKVMVPRGESIIMNNTYPYTPERKDEGRTIVPVSESPLIRALMSIANRVRIGSIRFFVGSQPQRISILISHVGGAHAGFTGDLVPTPVGESAVDWAQGLVDAYIQGVVPQPLPVYGLPGEIKGLVAGLNTSQTVFATLDVDVSIAASSANWVTIYLQPGVTIENLRIQANSDGLGNLLTHLAAPEVEKLINAKIATVLAALAGSAGSGPHDNRTANGTLTFSFGENTVVRDSPLRLPLILISCVGGVFGVLLVARNVRRHREQPVLNSVTGAPLSTFRIVAEDVFLIVSVVACLLLFSASNTMTGATVVLGDELRTYAFSLSNTVTDLWQAGLFPLSVCVLVFSGIYPYVKLLSILFFTVWAHRPSSRALKLIDCIGKLSLIDTFALMVMVSGLEIPSIADVRVHRSFYIFMYATIVSIALGNYATLLWRAGTTLRRDDAPVEDTGAHSTLGSAQGEPVTASPVEQQGSAPSMTGNSLPRGGASVQLQSGEHRTSCWRRFAGPALCIPLVFMIACSIPAWILPTFRYTVGGFARLLTPPSKSLTLWRLSSLGGRDDALDILAVAVFTILIAPCLYVALYPRCAFLASWCAADVLVIACVVGLLQLQQFVRFVLGDSRDILYTAHASLLWPMYLLAVAAVLVWVYIARDILHYVFVRKELIAMPPSA